MLYAVYALSSTTSLMVFLLYFLDFSWKQWPNRSSFEQDVSASVNAICAFPSSDMAHGNSNESGVIWLPDYRYCFSNQCMPIEIFSLYYLNISRYIKTKGVQCLAVCFLLLDRVGKVFVSVCNPIEIFYHSSCSSDTHSRNKGGGQ